MTEPLTVLGGITAEQFLAEYWQKKPLLVRNGLPEIIGLLQPQDVQELALEEHASARLIRQKDKNPNEWHVKSSPLTKGDFQKLPKATECLSVPLCITSSNFLYFPVHESYTGV